MLDHLIPLSYAGKYTVEVLYSIRLSSVRLRKPCATPRGPGDPFPFLPQDKYPRVLVTPEIWDEVRDMVKNWQAQSGRHGPVSSSGEAARILGISRDKLDGKIKELPQERRPINWGTEKMTRLWFPSPEAVIEWWQSALKPEESKPARTKKRRTRRRSQAAEGPVDFKAVEKELIASGK